MYDYKTKDYRIGIAIFQLLQPFVDFLFAFFCLFEFTLCFFNQTAL